MLVFFESHTINLSGKSVIVRVIEYTTTGQQADKDRATIMPSILKPVPIGLITTPCIGNVVQ